MTKRVDGGGVSDLSLYDMERRSSILLLRKRDIERRLSVTRKKKRRLSVVRICFFFTVN
jgi:hypothetical protein